MKRRRIIVELILLLGAVAAILIVLGLHTCRFVNIQQVVQSEKGGLAVIDETPTHTIFYEFDERGGMIRKHSEKTELSAWGQKNFYKNLQELNGQLYFQITTYDDSGVLSNDSLAMLTEQGIEIIFEESKLLIIDSLSVYDEKLYFVVGSQPATTLHEVVGAQPILAGQALMCYDQSSGMTSVLDLDGVETASSLTYAGQNTLLSYDADANIVLIDTVSGLPITLDWAGSVHAFAVDGDSFAFLDLQTGELVFATHQAPILRGEMPYLIRDQFSLKDQRIAAIELNNRQQGTAVVLGDLTVTPPSWTVFKPNFLSSLGIVRLLFSAGLYLLLYILLRAFLFVLIEMSIPIMMRIALMFLPFMAAGVLISNEVYTHMFFAQMTANAPQQLDNFAVKLDIAEIESVLLSSSVQTKTESEEYLRLTGLLTQADNFYCGVFIFKDNQFFSLAPNSFPKGSNIEYFYTQADFDNFLESTKSKRLYPFNATLKNPFQCYRISFFNDKEELHAVLELGVDLMPEFYMAKAMARKQIVPVIVILSVVFIVFLGITRIVLRSVQIIRDGVERITDGAADVRISVNSKDELGAIAAAFNKMSAYVDDKLREGAAYYRFVPDEISTFLGRTIASVKRGDSVTLPLPLCCFYMPNFYENQSVSLLKKRMTDSFDRMADILRHKNGYVKDMDTTGTFCLFKDTTRQALTTSLTICQNFKDYHVGLALDYGEATVAVMGESTRLQVGIVSNMTVRLRALRHYSEAFHANILLSKEAFHALDGADDFHYRMLGDVNVKGQKITLYDFFDADDTVLYRHKLNTLTDFNAGVAYFYQYELRKAQGSFIRVLRAFPEDSVSKQYLRLCEGEGHLWLT